MNSRRQTAFIIPPYLSHPCLPRLTLSGATVYCLLIFIACSSPIVIRAVGDSPHEWGQRRGNAWGSGYVPWGTDPPLGLLWRHRLNGAVAASPLFVGHKVLTATLTGRIYLRDGRTGTSIRTYKVDGAIHGTPALFDSLLFIPLSGGEASLIALNLTDGKAQWSANFGDISASLCLWEGLLLVGSERGEVVAVRAQTGEVLWRFKADDQIHSSPCSKDSLVYFGSDDDHLYAVSSKTGKLKWKYKADSSIYASPTADSSGIYFGTAMGTFYKLDPHSGEMVWIFKSEAGIYAGSACDVTTVYFGSNDRNLYALDKLSGRPIWRFTTKGVLKSAPVLTDNTVYFGSADRHLYALDRASGELKWKFETKGPIESPPAFGDSFIYAGSAGSESGYIYAFGKQVDSSP